MAISNHDAACSGADLYASRAGYRSPEVAAVEIPQSVANLSAMIENDLRGYLNWASADSITNASVQEIPGDEDRARALHLAYSAHSA